MCLASNVAVRDGNLVLTARHESVGWAQYTTGAVNSRGQRSFAATAAGPVRVCVSGRLPGSPSTGAGLWPAFWLMPDDSSCWPDHGELDIMEMINGDGVTHATYHVSTNATHCTGQDKSETSEKRLTDWADVDHEYAVEYGVDTFAFYVDGELLHNASGKLPVHNVPWYVILNFAVGGPWPHPPNASTVFPVETLVDYVRVSQAA